MPARETLELDILIVGAGPAGLSAALRLARLQRERGGRQLSVAVVEKGRTPGAHTLSGAVLDRSALAELVPDYAERGAPVGRPVSRDILRVLTSSRAIGVPFTPSPLSNRNHVVLALGDLVRWLARQVEDAGIDIFSGFAAQAPLIEEERVRGVRLVDRGLDRQGHPTSTYEPGADIRAGVTIFCDGVRGHLTKALARHFDLYAGRHPPLYALGMKEVWDVPRGRLAPGTVVHTVGYPLDWKQFGGGFLYGLDESRVTLGLVTGLDYRDPRFDPFEAFQAYKRHPSVRGVLEGGRMVQYGARALPEGGWYSIPRLVVDGALIAGDAGEFVNALRLKGIHLAMRTGMYAAEAAFEALQRSDTSAAGLERYRQRIDTGPVRRELFPVRNVHQAFERGLLPGIAASALALLTKGRWSPALGTGQPGHARMARLAEAPTTPAWAASHDDGGVTFDRVTSVHHSGTRHRDGQPAHLIVREPDLCRTRCVVEYGNPCTRFCPAAVYEIVNAGDGRTLHLNPSNCLHCKTCDIMDPYQVIEWIAPEGGDGPQYEGL